MSVHKLGWPLLSLLSMVLNACAPPPPLGPCGGETCRSYERCDPNTLHCVFDRAPGVSVSVPTHAVTTPTFEFSTLLVDDDPVSFEWVLGEGTLTAGPVGPAFIIEVPTPLLDSQVVTLTVIARDTRTETRAYEDVLIDRVPPRVAAITAPAQHSTVTTETISVAVETSGETERVTVSVGGYHGYLSGGPNSWSISNWLIPPFDGVSEVLLVEARDAAGNASTAELPIFIDNVP